MVRSHFVLLLLFLFLLHKAVVKKNTAATLNQNGESLKQNKKLSYRRGTARCVVSFEILPIATQQCRNYLYDKSWPNRWYEVGGLAGGNV